MVCGLSWNALWLISLPPLVSAAAAPTVDLGYAQYQGSYDTQTNITSFLSIRYAAPPVGKWRFQAPQAPANESGVHPATQNPPSCYQAEWGTQITPLVPPDGRIKRQSMVPTVSEDCLFLNVFIPGVIPVQSATAGGLPVLVWIHGGGYGIGNASQRNGADLVVNSLNNVLVVAIQYRIGVFGFLAGNEVKAHGALNAGLLDQNFALKWVQDHVGRFGGDKAHVTIWGESAGAGSVLQHIVAHGGNTNPPLFNAAITSSVYLPSQYNYNHRVPQFIYDKVANMTKCASTTDSFTCLQSVGVDALEKANLAVAESSFYHTFSLVPVVDDTFIVERPTVTLGKGKVNGQVLLTVTNQHEGNIFINEDYFPKQTLLALTNKKEGDIFMDMDQTLTIAEFIARLFPDMTSTQVQATAKAYNDYGTAYEQAVLMMGDSIFACPTHYLLKAFAGRSWKSYFAIPPADHGDDLNYYFFGPGHMPPYNNAQFLSAFAQSFMSFAKYYDVNKKIDSSNITPPWNKYNLSETEMLFNRTENGLPVVQAIKTDQGLDERCAFWATMASATAQ